MFFSNRMGFECTPSFPSSFKYLFECFLVFILLIRIHQIIVLRFYLKGMKEPVYEFDFGKRFVPIQEKYPKQQVFNWYLEDYQDKKDIAEFVMKKYLPELSPFDDYPKELEYPLIESANATNKRVPRWFGYELNHMKMREHRWSLVPFKYSAKATQLLKKPFSLPYGIDAVYTKNLEDFDANPIDVLQVSKKKDKKK